MATVKDQLKNEVLNLEEIKSAGEEMSEGWFQMLRLINKVGGHIIEFLAQLEELQKMLWQKRKFITETFYCITVGNIPKEFYPEIAACEAQWEEWKALFSIDEGKDGKNKKDHRIEFLKAHPTLVLDTRHFSPDFTDRLLKIFDDLDDATDGLLVHSENWQALNFLQNKFGNQIACIYADPPYNAKSSEILYKNTFKHSSWIALMRDRIYLSNRLRTADGALITAIDENEFDKLSLLFEELYPNLEKTCISIIHNPAGVQGDNFSYSHEYCIFIFEMRKNIIGKTDRTEDSEEAFRDWGGTSARSLAKNCFYPIIVKGGEIIGFGDVCRDDFHPQSSNIVKDDMIYVYPVAEDGEERKWVFSKNSVERIKNELNIRRRNEEIVITRTKTMTSYKTVWNDKRYYANIYGSKLLNHITGGKKFDFPKSIYTVQDCLWAVNAFRQRNAVCLDYFAGSGTSGHAIINLNREDGGRRKFILVEMAQYFDTVLLPRIKKVTFSPEWKNGKPRRMATAEEAERSPRIVKVIRLESYEDSLNNITFDEPSGQQAIQFEDYLLQYMLTWETRRSEALLNVEKLAKPFSYQLHIHRDGETRVKLVDLPETFAYLLGLYVEKRQVLNDNGRRYLVYRGVTREGRKAAVIWRETENWEEKDYKRDKEFVAAEQLTEGMDEVYVNGDSYIPGARSLEPLFKSRMFAEVEA